MNMRISNEAKTGLLVVVCLAALAAMVIKVGNFPVFEKGYMLKTRLHFSGGVKKNAPVRLCGVEVGTVKDIHILSDDNSAVEIGLFIDQGIKIRRDAVATIATMGLMGEMYIEIRQGTASAGIANAGDSIPAEDPVRLDDLIKLGTKIAEDVGEMARDISTVARDVDSAVADNRKKIDGIFDNLEETSENFREFSDDLKWHPWKVLAKGKEVPRSERDKARAERLTARAKELTAKPAA